jgi:hypothetical protein
MQGYGAPGIFSSLGLQSAGGCAMQIPDVSSVSTIAILFIGWGLLEDGCVYE